MAGYIPDPPQSTDAQARKLLRANQGRTVSGREKSNGSTAITGRKVSDAVGARGGSL